MSLVSSAHAEEALTHLTHQFAQWRQSRTTPRGRIPKPLWAQAITLAHVLPCARVAKHLGLTPQALKTTTRRKKQHARADAVLAAPPLCGSRGGVGYAHDGSGSPAPRWDAVANHV
jgi:hypothetical protein